MDAKLHFPRPREDVDGSLRLRDVCRAWTRRVASPWRYSNGSGNVGRGFVTHDARTGRNSPRLWLYHGATVLGVAAVLLAIAGLALMLANRSLLRQSDEQRQFLQQTEQLKVISDTLVRLIARAAIDEKDSRLRDLLVSHGFRIQGDASPAPANHPTANTPPAEPKK